MKRNKTAHAQAEQALFAAVGALKSEVEASAFLRDLCTPAELEALADRWRVARMLKAGKPYRTIAEEAEVSVTTVTRVARFLREGNGGYEAVLSRVTGDKP